MEVHAAGVLVVEIVMGVKTGVEVEQVEDIEELDKVERKDVGDEVETVVE